MLAIVIPYYKITFFEETLQSLANQTNQRFTVYIGDDASKENPLRLIQRYKGAFDFEYHRFEENLGSVSLTKQWERCIALTANEEWLMILGDDDYLSQNYIEAFYKHVEEINKIGIKVIHFASRIHQQNNEISKLYKHPKIEKATDYFYKIYFEDSRGTLTEQIFRRESFLEHGFRNFPLGWGADHFAWMDFTNFGEIYAINEATAYFRVSKENISRQGYQSEIKKEAKYSLFRLLFDKYLNKFEKKQRLDIILRYERLVYRYRKDSLKVWIEISVCFFKEFEFSHIYKSTKKYIKNHMK